MDSVPNTSIDHRQSLPSRPLSRKTEPRGHGLAKVEGGFPHSEIRGSKPVRGSPRLIAAYHVLHRLSAPRHPPDTLMTLDHSHHRCPPKGHRRQGLVAGTKPGSTRGWTQRPLLPNMSETGGGQPPRHRAPPCATRLTTGRQQDRIGPSVSAASASFARLAADPEGRTHSLFTMSNNWLARRRAAPGPMAGRCASRLCRWRILYDADRIRGPGRFRSTVGPDHGPEDHGGARRDRTDDLMLAKHALYRLSYCPESTMARHRPARLDWWAWEDSNFRPHAYQARALTN